MKISHKDCSLNKLKAEKAKLLAQLNSIELNRKTRSSAIKIQGIQNKIFSLLKSIDSIDTSFSANLKMPNLKHTPLVSQTKNTQAGIAVLPKPLQEALSLVTQAEPQILGSMLPNPMVVIHKINNNEINSAVSHENRDIMRDTDGARALSPNNHSNPNNSEILHDYSEKNVAFEAPRSTGTVPKIFQNSKLNNFQTNFETDSSKESFRNFDFRPSTPVSMRKLREYMENDEQTKKFDLPNPRPVFEKKKLEFSSSTPPAVKENAPSHSAQNSQLPQNQMFPNQIPYQMYANNPQNVNPMNSYAHFNMNAFNPYPYMNQFLPFLPNLPHYSSFLPNSSPYNGYVQPMHQGHNLMPQSNSQHLPNQFSNLDSRQANFPDNTTQHNRFDSRNCHSQRTPHLSSHNNMYSANHHDYNDSNRNPSQNFNERNGNQNFCDQNSQCRRTFMKYLESIPLFSGQSREDLMNFIEICDTINAFCSNESEYVEFITKITFQLRGEARAVISNGTNWTDIKNGLFSKFQYLSNRSILDSQIENLRQTKDENLTRYSERARKLLAEKNKSFYSLSEEQKTEHDRIARKFFARGLENRKLRDIMVIQGCPTLEETIGRSLEIENELINTISQQEFNCTYCKRPGHRVTECRSKQNNSSPIGQLASILQNLSFQNNNQQQSNRQNSNRNYNSNNNSFGNNNNANYGRNGTNNNNSNQNNSNSNNQRNFQNNSGGYQNNSRNYSNNNSSNYSNNNSSSYSNNNSRNNSNNNSNYSNNDSSNYSNNNSSNYSRNNSNNTNFNNNQRGNTNNNQNRPNNNQPYYSNSNNNVRSVTLSEDRDNNPNIYSLDNSEN